MSRDPRARHRVRRGMPAHHDATTGRYTTEADAHERPGQTIREDDTRVRELTAEVADLRESLRVAHEDADRYFLAIERVRAMHHPTPTPNSEHYYCDPDECDRAGEGELVDECDLCWGSWPCPTVRALDGEEGDRG